MQSHEDTEAAARDDNVDGRHRDRGSSSSMLDHLQELADAEQEDNDIEFAHRKGAHVTYGNIVQLYHVASRRYLRISTTATSLREPR